MVPSVTRYIHSNMLYNFFELQSLESQYDKIDPFISKLLEVTEETHRPLFIINSKDIIFMYFITKAFKGVFLYYCVVNIVTLKSEQSIFVLLKLQWLRSPLLVPSAAVTNYQEFSCLHVVILQFQGVCAGVQNQSCQAYVVKEEQLVHPVGIADSRFFNFQGCLCSFPCLTSLQHLLVTHLLAFSFSSKDLLYWVYCQSNLGDSSCFRTLNLLRSSKSLTI